MRQRIALDYIAQIAKDAMRSNAESREYAGYIESEISFDLSESSARHTGNSALVDPSNREMNHKLSKLKISYCILGCEIVAEGEMLADAQTHGAGV